jgi:chromosome segregation ATPase
VEELTQLLSSANQSGTDARNAAQAAEDKRNVLEHRHEETLRLLSQQEEDLCSCRAIIDEIETEVRGLTNRGSSDDLLAELAQLRDQKEKAEGQLEQERYAWEQTEVELKCLMGEEQIMRVQEAEAKMSLLRTEYDQLESDLALLEAETIFCHARYRRVARSKQTRAEVHGGRSISIL